MIECVCVSVFLRVFVCVCVMRAAETCIYRLLAVHVCMRDVLRMHIHPRARVRACVRTCSCEAIRIHACHPCARREKTHHTLQPPLHQPTHVIFSLKKQVKKHGLELNTLLGMRAVQLVEIHTIITHLFFMSDLGLPGLPPPSRNVTSVSGQANDSWPSMLPSCQTHLKRSCVRKHTQHHP